MSNTTVEEIEIIVTAKVEEALREFKKIKPELEKAMQEMVKQMSKIDFKQIGQKVQKAVQEVKNKIQILKKFTENNEIKIKVTNDEASRQITQLEKEIESLQKKITSRELKLNITTDTIDKIRYGKQDEIRRQNPNLSDMQVSNRADFQLSSDTGYTSLVNQADKLNTEVTKYNSLLESAKSKLSGLKQNISQVATEQEKSNTKTSKLQTIFTSVGAGIKSMLSGLGKMFQEGGKVVNIFKKFTPHLGNGMKSLLKYAATLFSLKSVYNTLNSAGQAWLSSQDSGAKQLSENIEYMKYAMGSVFAPVIEYLINLVYQLMKAFQSVVYAMTGMNVFAKATASSMSSTANSANKASKSLSSIHSDINNVSSNENSSGSGTSTPSIDLSEVDTELTSWQARLAEFFKPLVDSWNTYSPSLIAAAKETFSQIGQLLESVGQSFINIFVNGTVYSILENILGIIGNIAEAFANAWNYNGNGDAIIQNLADALNNLLTIIDMITGSVIFQWLIDIGVSAIRLATEAIEGLSEAVLWVCEKIGEFVGYFTGENSDKIDGWAIILGSLASAILLVVSAVTAWNVISTIATVATTAFGVALNVLTSPITLIVLAIAAVIAIIATLIIYWDEIKEATSNAIEAMEEFISNGIEKIKEIFNMVIEWIKENWQGLLLLLVNPFAGAFKLLYDNCEGFRNFINEFVEKIKNFFKDLWESIKNTLSNIGSFFSNIFNSIASTITNVFNGIWSTIKGVINQVLSGFETMVNGVISGVNWILSGISNIANAVGSVIGLDPISIQLSTISLPRFNKGNVAWKETLGIFGEYSGAQNDPEITSPQSIMYDTFMRALRENAKEEPQVNVNLAIQLGAEKIYQKFIEYINDYTRTNGSNPIVFSD